MLNINDTTKSFEINGKKYKLRTKPPYTIRVALKFIETGKLPWYIKLALKTRFGRFRTPSGIEYEGIKVLFKW